MMAGRDDDDDEGEDGASAQSSGISSELLSITARAKEEFDRPEYANLVASPVILRNFAVRKDSPQRCLGGGEEEGLRQAPNFASAILGRWLATKLGLAGRPPERRTVATGEYVVSDVTALLLPGEGTLILGPSSSGKTTLMRAICDKISGKIPANKTNNLEGTLLLGATDPSENQRNLTRTTAFVDQGDLSLTPVLTVDETVRFARICAEGDVARMEESMDVIFQLFGLEHVRDTVVGNADIRGVSGGQKRRVKALEMAVGIDVTTMFMDEITNGLDAASALAICKVLRALLEVTRCICVTCLLQPSTEVFRTFHRLLLLTQDGKVAYSGKTENAVAHFETLGLIKPAGMNEPEFLLRCVSSPADFRDPGAEIPAAVSSSADLAQAFRQSEACRALVAEIDHVLAEEAEKDSSLSGNDLADFALPTHLQVAVVMWRGWKLVVRNPTSLLRIIIAIVFGAFIGTLFLNTSSDENGTRLRSGYAMTLLFLSFLNSCMAPLEDLYNDRITFYTHRRATFYRTTSYYISQVVCSAPVALLETFFLAVISFFLVGMNTHGSWGFFYFWLQFSLLTLNGTAISRILAYSLPSNDMAQTLGPAALLLFVIAACYSPQYPQLPVWLKWLAWISPCAYCYEGVIVSDTFNRYVGNETGSIFAQEELGIPRIPYDSAPSGLSSEMLVMAFDSYMLIIWVLFFDVCGCCLLHCSRNWYGPTTKRYQVACGMGLATPPNYVPSMTNETRTEQSLASDSGGIPPAAPAHLRARSIAYEVDVPVVEEQLSPGKDVEETLSFKKSKVGVSGELDSESRGIPITAREYGQTGRGAVQERLIQRRLGEDAISSMGSSTSTNQLSIRIELEPPKPGRLRLLSGITASFAPGSITALMGSSGAGKTTLLDVLAGYKTGGHISGDISINGQPRTDATWRSIAGYCEQVDLHNPALTVLESLVFAARMRLRPFDIADDVKVTFANKILALLELQEFSDMLVGDEATGEGLPKHARKRLTVGVELVANPSILFADEPTSGLDSLSAITVVSSLKRAAKKQGLTVVCTIHQPSREVFSSFDNLLLLRKGGVCVYNGQIAEIDKHMQSAPNGHEYAMPSEANPADHVLDVFCGPSGEKVDWSELYEASDMASDAIRAHKSCSLGAISVNTTPQSFWTELFVEAQRQIQANWRTPSYMAVRFWWTVAANIIVGLVYLQSSEVLNIIGAMFFYINIATVPLLSAVVPLVTQRAVFYREVASGTYRRAVYGMAALVAEVPFNMVAAVVAFVIFYFLVGLKMEVERVFYFLLMSLAAYWVLPTFGQLLAFVSPNIGAAVALGSLLMTLFTLTMGFLIPANSIPTWWIWIYWINPLRYILQGMVVNEVGGEPEGDKKLDVLSWSYDDRWWYCYAAVLLFGAAACVGVVAATRISWLKR